jgi:GT2 family glycosyltransferase
MWKPAQYIGATVYSSNIAGNRNEITQVMLDNAADWVLYLDDDHILPQDVLPRLLAADKDVVSALYTQRQPPFDPVLFDSEVKGGGHIRKSLKNGEHGLVKVSAAGAGCLLVKRKVIEALTPPYWTLGQIDAGSWGDDLDFCNRVRAAGFDIYCDLDTSIGHSMTGVVWPAYDAANGWVANFSRNAQDPPIAQWLMPMSNI